MEDRRNCRGGWPTERRFTRDHLVEHTGEGVLVGPAIDLLLAPRLLRTHVDWRAHDHPRGGELFVHVAHRPGHPEVGHHDLVALEQDVVGLDVAVDDALFMGLGQRRADGPGDGERAWQGDRFLVQEQVAEVLALHVGHGEPEEVFDLPRIEDAQDVRMVQLARNADLAPETVLPYRLRQLGVQYLERDLPVVHQVVGQRDPGLPPRPRGCSKR